MWTRITMTPVLGAWRVTEERFDCSEWRVKNAGQGAMKEKSLHNISMYKAKCFHQASV